MDKVLEFIKKLNISKEENIVIGCSGGPDSIFLLDLLNKLGYKCICAHVNHNVREASKDEYVFLSDFCKKNNIVFKGITITNYDTKLNFHEYAREFRYSFFKDLVKKYNVRYLFTAHHGDDLTETILMRLVRGSSLRGYAGFEPIVDKGDYKIIRPLIFLTKEEIEDYDKNNNIEYVIDESNLTDHYTRNRFRHHVLPFLKEEKNDVHLKFLSYSQSLYECMNYIDNITYNYMSEIYIDDLLDLNKFNELDLFIKKQILEKILKTWYLDNLYLVSESTINDILNVVSNDKPNIVFNLPDNLKIIKEYNKLIFTRETNLVKSYNIEFTDLVDIDSHHFEKISSSDSKSNYIIRLNSKDIKLPLFLRNKNDGDVIEVKNMNGSTKIKKIFIDSKVSVMERENYPLLVDSNNEILWVPGIKKSKKDIEKGLEYDIIIKYEKRREENEKSKEN